MDTLDLPCTDSRHCINTNHNKYFHVEIKLGYYSYRNIVNNNITLLMVLH